MMSGVTIGNGAVVGGSSVVARDVPGYAIVAGNPAEVRRSGRDRSPRVDRLVGLVDGARRGTG